MQDQLPLLVFAQSGRFIAESATLAGYTVWVADCFGDNDTISVASRFLKLPPISALTAKQLADYLITLSNQQACLLIYGTGIEQLYDVLALLPLYIHPIGNNVEQLKQLVNASDFFPLLDKLRIPYPKTSSSKPSNPDQWLAKRLDSFGGVDVTHARLSPVSETVIYQKEIIGKTYSASFIADGEAIMILGFNQQINAADSFQLESINTLNIFDINIRSNVESWLVRIVKHLKYKGFASVDFIVDSSDHAYLLEINPRLSASAEILFIDTNIVEHHIQLCDGLALSECDIKLTNHEHTRQLSYLRAEVTCFIGARAQWPEECHDIPSANTVIEAMQPICSVLITAESLTACNENLTRIKTTLNKITLPKLEID